MKAIIIFIATLLLTTCKDEASKTLLSPEGPTTFNVTSMEGTTVNDPNYLIVLDQKDSRFNSSGFCNTINGQFFLEGTSIRFSKVAATKKLCPEAIKMSHERKVLKLLPSVTQYKIDRDQVILMDEENNELVTLKKIK